MPLAHEYALAGALVAINAFTARVYKVHQQRPRSSPLESFSFSGGDDCDWLVSASVKQGTSTLVWGQMIVSQDRPANPKVTIIGRTERLDVLGVMLSYLALRRGQVLSYRLPILKQVLTASADGVLTLNG